MHIPLVVQFRQYLSHMSHGAARFMLAQPLRAFAARGLLFHIIQLLYMQRGLANSSCDACSAIGTPRLLKLLLS